MLWKPGVVLQDIASTAILRDAALARIGLSGKEYMELKKKLAEELLSKSS